MYLQRQPTSSSHTHTSSPHPPTKRQSHLEFAQMHTLPHTSQCTPSHPPTHLFHKITPALIPLKYVPLLCPERERERRGRWVRRVGCEGSGRQALCVGAGKSEDQDPTVLSTLQVEILRIERGSEAGVEEAGTQGAGPHMDNMLPQGESDVPQPCS